MRKSVRRKRSIRKKMIGTPSRPRLTVNKSNRILSAQLVDDIAGETICGLSTNSETVSGKASSRPYTLKNKELAEKLGKEIAGLAKKQNIEKVVFDRSGYRYHGVVRIIAESARKGGLNF